MVDDPVAWVRRGRCPDGSAAGPSCSITADGKHAPGTDVTVSVTGAAGDGLAVTVRNAPPAGDVPPSPAPGRA